MDILEMKQEAAMDAADRRVDEEINSWTHPIGTLVEGRAFGNDREVEIIQGRTASMGLRRWPVTSLLLDTGREVWLNSAKVIEKRKRTK